MAFIRDKELKLSLMAVTTKDHMLTICLMGKVCSHGLMVLITEVGLRKASFLGKESRFKLTATDTRVNTSTTKLRVKAY